MADEAGSTAPGPAAGQAAPAGEKGAKGALGLLLVLLLVAGAAAGGFFVGRSNGEDRGENSVRTRYEPGGTAYRAIYDAGREAGVSATTAAAAKAQKEAARKAEKGKKLALEKGEQKGEITGANDVFDAFPSWNTGAHYIVLIGKGTGGVDYAIASRTQMEARNDYKLCADDPDQICVVER